MADPSYIFARSNTSVAAGEYQHKWREYERLSAEHSITSPFEAGKIAGELLLDIILLVLTILDGVGLAVRVATKLPELARWARALRGVRRRAPVLRAEKLAARSRRQGRPLACHLQQTKVSLVL